MKVRLELRQLIHPQINLIFQFSKGNFYWKQIVVLVRLGYKT